MLFLTKDCVTSERCHQPGTGSLIRAFEGVISDPSYRSLYLLSFVTGFNLLILGWVFFQRKFMSGTSLCCFIFPVWSNCHVSTASEQGDRKPTFLFPCRGCKKNGFDTVNVWLNSPMKPLCLDVSFLSRNFQIIISISSLESYYIGLIHLGSVWEGGFSSQFLLGCQLYGH